MEHDQIAASLRLALDREAARHEISPGAWSRIERRIRRRARRRAGIVALCAAVVVAAAAVTPYLWRTISGPATSHPPPRPAPQLVIVGRAQESPTLRPVTGVYGLSAPAWSTGLTRPPPGSWPPSPCPEPARS